LYGDYYDEKEILLAAADYAEKKILAVADYAEKKLFVDCRLRSWRHPSWILDRFGSSR
jgi:hypothetical protein